MMDAITRLQEMAAKAEKELQEFEARFKEDDKKHVFTGVGCLESTDSLAELFTVIQRKKADSPTVIGVSPSQFSGLSNENRAEMEGDVHKFLASKDFDSEKYPLAAQVLSAKYRHEYAFAVAAQKLAETSTIQRYGDNKAQQDATAITNKANLDFLVGRRRFALLTFLIMYQT